MGVPYKIDKKIVAFIIKKKIDQPNLGCRSFVDLVKENFRVDISKSSVNSIIQEADLSKRVGRPRKPHLPESPKLKEEPSAPEKKPEIPAQKQLVLPPKKEEEKWLPEKLEIPEQLPSKKEEKPILLSEEIKPPKKPEAPPIAISEKPKEIPNPELPKLVHKPESQQEEKDKKPAEEEKSKQPSIEVPQVEPEKPKEIPKPEAPKPVPKPEIPSERKPIESPKEEKPAPPKPIPVKPKPESKPAAPEPAKAQEPKKAAALEVSSFMQPVKIKEDEVFDSMGTYFLKAAEWEISKASILGNIVRELIPDIDPKEAEVKSNILLYLTAFGLINLKKLDDYNKQGLWAIANSQEKLDSSKMLDFVHKIRGKEDLISRVHDECISSFQEAHYYKFVLSDGSGFFIDARLKSIWQEANIPDNLTVNVDKAREYVENRFVQFFKKNVQSVLLFNVPSFRSFSPIVSEFVHSFEDPSSKRIIQIDICDYKKNVLKSYKNIVPAKRSFVFGFWPWQKEATEFLKGDIGLVRDFYFSELAKQIYYTERQVLFPQGAEGAGVELNLIFLKNSAFSSPRMGLLTNIPLQTIDSQGVIKSFLLRWPNFEDTYQDLMASSERLTYRGFVYPVFDEEKAPKKEHIYIQSNYPKSLDENLKTMLTNLSTAAQRHFFPYGYRFADFSTVKERFYSLPGRLQRKDNHLYVTLLPPKGFTYSNDLLYAARRVNESEVLDPFGYKLWFKVL